MLFTDGKVKYMTLMQNIIWDLKKPLRVAVDQAHQDTWLKKCIMELLTKQIFIDYNVYVKFWTEIFESESSKYSKNMSQITS